MERHGDARPLSEIASLTALTPEQYAGFDAVCDALALAVDHGVVEIHVSGRRVSDVRWGAKVHLKGGAKVSEAVRRLSRRAS